MLNLPNSCVCIFAGVLATQIVARLCNNMRSRCLLKQASAIIVQSFVSDDTDMLTAGVSQLLATLRANSVKYPVTC